MNMIGDMNKFTQYEVAQSIPIAAANEGGGGVGIGAGPRRRYGNRTDNGRRRGIHRQPRSRRHPPRLAAVD